MEVLGKRVFRRPLPPFRKSALHFIRAILLLCCSLFIPDHFKQSALGSSTPAYLNRCAVRVVRYGPAYFLEGYSTASQSSGQWRVRTIISSQFVPDAFLQPNLNEQTSCDSSGKAAKLRFANCFTNALIWFANCFTNALIWFVNVAINDK